MRAPGLSLLLILTAVSACGNDRDGRNYIILRDSSVGRPDAIEMFDDSGLPINRDGGIDDGNTNIPDADPRDGEETFPDAQERDASGFPDANGPHDSGRPDLGVPSFPDAGRDAGLPFDAGRPDAGRPDSGQWDSGQPDSGTPPQFQTTVTLTPGTSLVTMNLQPPVQPDPLSFSAELTYDNIGPGSQLISITNVSLSVIVITLQDFVAGPAYNAPVGFTTHTVSKAPGTAAAISIPETYCGFPMIVTIDFSNGAQATDITTITCVQ
jgi:hypothetical protein